LLSKNGDGNTCKGRLVVVNHAAPYSRFFFLWESSQAKKNRE
jgi:hypothetical protein